MRTDTSLIAHVTVFLLLLSLSSCVVKMPLAEGYFNNKKEVGVVYNIDSIGVYKEGAQGLLDMALTAGKKFREPLRVVDQNLHATDEIVNLYTGIFQSKGKPLSHTPIELTKDELKKYNPPNTTTDKKYFKYDLRHLKDLGIDELLIVDVRYGLLVSYYGMIETGKKGYCRIDAQIIDLKDNSIVYKNFSNSAQKIEGKWKSPPEYKSLKISIDKAIREAVRLENEKFTQ